MAEDDKNEGEREIKKVPSRDLHRKGEETVLHLLRVALTHIEQGKWEEAKQCLLRIEALNPEGMYARLASEYLQEIIDQEDEGMESV